MTFADCHSHADSDGHRDRYANGDCSAERNPDADGHAKALAAIAAEREAIERLRASVQEDMARAKQAGQRKPDAENEIARLQQENAGLRQKLEAMAKRDTKAPSNAGFDDFGPRQHATAPKGTVATLDDVLGEIGRAHV